MSTFAGVGYQTVQGRVRTFNVRSEAINGRQQVRNVGGERLEWTVRFVPLTPEEADTLWQTLDNQNGGIGTFTMSLPNPRRIGGNFYQNYTVRLANDVQEYAVRNDGLIEIEIDVLEVR